MTKRKAALDKLAVQFMNMVVDDTVEFAMYGAPENSEYAFWVKSTYSTLRREAAHISVDVLRQLEAKFLDVVKREYADRGNGQNILNGQRWTLIDGLILYEDDLPNICLKEDYIKDGELIHPKGRVDVVSVPCDERCVVVSCTRPTGEEYYYDIETDLLEVCND